jgi:hypothetical protein
MTRPSDTRGAVLVAALFMAAALVGALWYVIGVGDAILYRQRMQDAADAAAYSGAVIHARGMNLIALVNVVMAGVLAVLVALELVQLLNLAALVLSCAASALCSVGVGCWAVPICTFTNSLREPIATAVDRYEGTVVDRVLPVLAHTQRAVAAATPALAAARGATAAGEGRFVRSAVVIGASPSGLPVQPGSPAVLCERAGQQAGQVAFQPFPFGDWLAGVTGDLASSFPRTFCGDGTEAPSLGDLDRAVDEQCGLMQEAWASDVEFDLDECREDVRRETRTAFGDETRDVAVGSRSSPRPQQVQPAARNGSDALQVWSVVRGDPAQLRGVDAGVRVALWSGRRATALPIASGFGFAQAEYYYDTDRPWDDVREEALYNLRWRARLRRVRWPETILRRLPAELRTALTGSTQAVIH